MFDAEDPKAFRRASRGTYSAAFYEMAEDPAAIHARVQPLAPSRLVLHREGLPDLGPGPADADEVPPGISESGRGLDELDPLPSPVPLGEALPRRGRRPVRRLVAVGGV